MSYKGFVAKSSTHENLKSSLLLAVDLADLRNQSNIYHSCHSVFFTACEIELELSWQALVHWVSKQKLGSSYCVWCDVKLLFTAHACKWTAHYISNGITTCFS